MDKLKNEQQHFDETKILNSEPKFIDIYKERNVQDHPIKTLFKFYKGHYLEIVLVCILHIIKSSPVWILPIISADVINLVVERPANMITKFIIDGIIVVVSLAQNIPFHMLQVKLFSDANRSVEAGLRGAMIRKLQQLSITFHKDMASGKIQSKVMRDVEAVIEFVNGIFETFVTCGVHLIITLVVVINKSVYVFLMFLVCIPIAVLIRQKFRTPMRERNHQFRKKVENTSIAVFDMEELVPVTRAHALENKEIAKFTTAVTKVAEEGYRMDRINSLFSSVSWASLQFIRMVCLFVTAWMALRKMVTIGDLSLFQSYFNSLTGYVSSFIALLPIIAKGSESIRSIGEILSAYDVEDNSNKRQIKNLAGKYEFKDISFDYDERTHVLTDFNLTVEPGETVALVGESGSGKSTIMNLVIGFNKAHSGQLLIDGININDIDLHSYRRMISVVPQNTILFSGSIKDNITYGRKHITDEQLKEVIHMAQLDSVIEKLPDGINTMVGEHGSKLSGGQRQRISIARAIIRDPRVIIFDEATSALDSVTEREIQAAIDSLTRDRTTFIVAHRLSTIKNADKIAVLRDGRCVEYGTYDELLAKKGEFYHYKQMQS